MLTTSQILSPHHLSQASRNSAREEASIL